MKHDIKAQVAAAVAVEPVAVTDFNPDVDAPAPVVGMEGQLRVHGELLVEVEERGEVEFHRGNTEFDYESGMVYVDGREEVHSIPMDRLCYAERHYDV